MPIKLEQYLKPISREHHHGLLLCWKIKAGIKKNIEASRINKYADWFYENHLLPQFEIEEKYIYTILDKNNALVKRALAEHRKLNRLFQSKTELQRKLNLIEETLENHIRFEERELFNEIQTYATAEQLQQIQLFHSDEIFMDNLTDPFWE